MEDSIIKIENVSKKYKLGSIGGGTLKGDIQSWVARKRGMQDPNTIIGQEMTKDAYNKEFYALKNINIEVKRGEALGIIGANGAGKSTLLKILSRVTAPSEGEIKIKGRISSMLEVGTGFHGELSGRENIYLNGAILGMSKGEVDEKIEAIIDFSECRKFIDTPVKRYSSGMYVKLAFAVSAHLESEILVMDEVLAVGDMKFQEKCLGKMSDVAERGEKTVLYVSHNMNTIRKLCTRCIVLNGGKVIYDGEVERAIDIYMELDSDKIFSSYNFLNSKRTTSDLGKKIFMEDFVFLQKETPIFYLEERMKFRIKWCAYTDVENIRLYFAIKNADSTSVGLMESLPFADAKRGERYCNEFEVDISNLAPGRYYFLPTFFAINQFSTNESFDQPIDKVFFEIKDDMVNRISWRKNVWGSVRLNLIKQKKNME